GTFRASDVADIANPMDVPLPVDISLSADDGFLFVDTFMDGTCRVYDVSDPHQPKLVHTQKIGSQVNMVSETWDGKRVYLTWPRRAEARVKRHRIVATAVLALGAAAASAGDDARLRAADPAELSYTYAVGAFAPEYTPPAPGSYTLPPIDTVTDHALLDADGRPTTLFALTQGRLAVVAFVYTTCIEATGCPLSLAVLHRLDRAIAADAELARRVVLVTISFDPERDTPADP